MNGTYLVRTYADTDHSKLWVHDGIQPVAITCLQTAARTALRPHSW